VYSTSLGRDGTLSSHVASLGSQTVPLVASSAWPYGTISQVGRTRGALKEGLFQTRTGKTPLSIGECNQKAQEPCEPPDQRRRGVAINIRISRRLPLGGVVRVRCRDHRSDGHHAPMPSGFAEINTDQGKPCLRKHRERNTIDC
jgi:hypothetical protein